MKYRIFYANHYWWRLTLIRPDGESASVVAAQSPSGRHLTFDGFGVIGRIPRGLSAMLLLLDHTEAPFNRVALTLASRFPQVRRWLARP